MTPEERIAVCQVCKNRKFNPESGIVCGLTGEKPAFEDSCPDYGVDAVAVEDVEKSKAEVAKSVDIGGFLAFFLYFWIPIGIVGTIIGFIVNYNSGDYAGSFCFKALDIVYILFYVSFAAYTVYAFVKRKPDAVFFGKYILILLFLSNALVLLMGADGEGILNNSTRLTGSLFWAFIFFLYLSFSDRVKSLIPKETRKLEGTGRILFIVSLVLMALLFVGGIVEIYGKNVGFGSAENKIERVCETNRASLPSDQGNGLTWTDMRVEGKQLVYEYRNGNADKDVLDSTTIELTRLSVKERFMKSLVGLTAADPIFSLLADAGYDMVMRYSDTDGDFLYEVMLPKDEIAAATKPGYYYKTSKETFDHLLEVYEDLLPYDFFDDCIVRGVSLSSDESTLHYDLLLTHTTRSVLADLSRSYLKEFMAELLPFMQKDATLLVAEINRKDISFDFHADCNKNWLMSATFTPDDYKSLIDETDEDEDFTIDLSKYEIE